MRALSTFSRHTPSLQNTGALRLDRFALGKRPDGTLDYGNVLAMWVADMDFQAPQHITNALVHRAQQGMFGYPTATARDYDSILHYLEYRHALKQIKQDSIVLLPALVPALNACARAFASKETSVLVMPPVYPPFLSAPALQHSSICPVPLLKPTEQSSNSVGWEVDWQGLQASVAVGGEGKPKPSALFLCNPHNPVGKVFTEQELVRLLEFCRANNVVLVSDEIHCDLVFRNQHVSVLGRGYDDIVVVLHAPSKTYNLAGIGAAFAVIPNSELRTKFKRENRGIMADISVFGLCAMREAYGNFELSEQWRQGLLHTLERNRDIIAEHCSAPQSKVKFHAQHHNATYLAWLDCSEVMSSEQEEFINAQQLFLRKRGLALNDGGMFFPQAKQGSSIVRLNFACSEERLLEALKRMGL